MTELSREEKILRIRDLSRYDHAFLSEEGVKHFAQPFGFDGYCVVMQDNREDPKGLHLDNGLKEAKGCDAADLAADICRQLGLTYTEKFGRGSKLRECCRVILEHLESEKP